MKGIAMYIRTSVKYSLIAVAYIADNSKKGYVKALSVSKEYNLPLEYLLRLMKTLVRANVLKSKRGPDGGFCLARPAKEIALYDIIEVIEKPLDRVDKISQYTKTAPFAVKMVNVCKDAIAAEKTILQKAKLSQMIK
jgi:Rrf2 family protein